MYDIHESFCSYYAISLYLIRKCRKWRPTPPARPHPLQEYIRIISPDLNNAELGHERTLQKAIA